MVPELAVGGTGALLLGRDRLGQARDLEVRIDLAAHRLETEVGRGLAGKVHLDVAAHRLDRAWPVGEAAEDDGHARAHAPGLARAGRVEEPDPARDVADVEGAFDAADDDVPL